MLRCVARTVAGSRPMCARCAACSPSSSHGGGFDAAPQRRHLSGLQSFCVDLSRRALISQTHPPNLPADNFRIASTLPDVLYAGFDPTAESLHVGNLLVVNGLLRAALHGCQSIALVGESTALVGDPSGRGTDRNEIRNEVAALNARKLRSQLEKLFANFRNIYGNNLPENRTLLVTNAYWQTEMSWLDFMRICRFFRVGNMQRMGALKERLRSGDSVLCSEFLYQIMQSHDWFRLASQYECFFQLGGNDQLGHVDAGYNYIRKRIERPSAGVCLPIIADKSGAKMGKSNASSSGGNVWLDEAQTSAFAFFQFWRQMSDKEIAPLVRYYSLRPVEEIDSMMERHEANLGGWIAQEWLACEMTSLVHGQEALERVLQFSKTLFSDSFEELRKISALGLENFFGAASILNLSPSTIRTYGDLAEQTRDSGKATKNLMLKGAFKLNGERYTNPDEVLDVGKLRFDGKNLTLVCWGKRNYRLIRWI